MIMSKYFLNIENKKCIENLKKEWLVEIEKLVRRVLSTTQKK